MYDGNVVTGGGRTTAEEYLLGKKYDGDKDQEDVGKVCSSLLSHFWLSFLLSPKTPSSFLRHYDNLHSRQQSAAQDAAQKIRNDTPTTCD